MMSCFNDTFKIRLTTRLLICYI